MTTMSVSCVCGDRKMNFAIVTLNDDGVSWMICDSCFRCHYLNRNFPWYLFVMIGMIALCLFDVIIYFLFFMFFFLFLGWKKNC